MRKKNSNLGLFYLGLFIAIGLTASGYFIGNTIYKSNSGINTAKVRGLSERLVRSDSAKWSINFKVTEKQNVSSQSLYKKAEDYQQKIISFLKANGLKEDEIDIDSINYGEIEYRNSGKVVVDQTKFVTGIISVRSNDVKKVKDARVKIGQLIAEGLHIYNNPVVYKFTKLNDIKPDMLKEANENAKIAANEFAKTAGVKVGGIKNANQGSFSILDEGESFGDSEKINKTVRVVTTISFYLVD